jgi:hypothetical protein
MLKNNYGKVLKTELRRFKGGGCAGCQNRSDRGASRRSGEETARLLALPGSIAVTAEEPAATG